MLKEYTSRTGRLVGSNRNRSLVTTGVAILAAITFALASLGAQPYDRQPSERLWSTRAAKSRAGQTPSTGSSMMAVPLVAPLVPQDERFNSMLSFVNASNVNTYATVTLRSLTGQTILQKMVSLPGSSPVQIAVQQLLQEANSQETRGSIVVEQSPDLKGLAVFAQLSITYQGSRASYIDEELAMPDPAMGSAVLRGVARGDEESMLVAISSLAQVAQQIQVDCFADVATPRSMTVELAPNATVITRPCSLDDFRTESQTDHAKDEKSGKLGAVGVQLVSSAGPGQFAAFGIVGHVGEDDRNFGAVPFSDPKLAASSSTVFAGLPVGAADLLGPGSYKPYVALANFSLRSAHVTVRFSRTSGLSGSTIASDTPVGDINLPPLRTQILPLADLQGDSAMRNSFVVTSDAAPGDIGVSMASKAPGNEGEVELLGKDAQQPENAGAHPWSVAHGNDSTVLIFNHTQQEQRVMATILNGKALWQKLIKLSPLETIALSMNDLIKNQVRDDRKGILPADLVEGEIIWTMSDPKTVTGRLLVSNRIAAMARNFSCSPTAELCGASLSPGSATIPVNGTTTFYGSWSTCLSYTPGQCNGPATTGLSPNFSWTNGSNINQTCSGSNSCSPVGTSPGTALLTVYVSSGLCTQQASSNVTVTAPPTATITQRTSGTVSSDDAALPNYQNLYGTSNLGAIFPPGTYGGCALGYETIGTITPSVYNSSVIIHRWLISRSDPVNSASGLIDGPFGDDSFAQYRDDLPQSGGSNGKVYDTDAPFVAPGNVDGNTYRYRLNFYTYAALPDGTLISPNYYFYVRLSCTRNSFGYQFVNDVPGDNQIGSGSTPLTWNLQ